MKKAKIMLSAIAVFAIVGGALAFKAQKFGAANIYCAQNCPSNSKVKYNSVDPGAAVTSTTPCGANQTIYFSNAGGCQIYTTTPTTTSPLYSVANL